MVDTDIEVIDRLAELDGSDDVTVDDWEMNFLDNVLFQKTLSGPQRESALKMLDKYEY